MNLNLHELIETQEKVIAKLRAQLEAIQSNPHEFEVVGRIGNWGKVEWDEGVIPQYGQYLYGKIK